MTPLELSLIDVTICRISLTVVNYDPWGIIYTHLLCLLYNCHLWWYSIDDCNMFIVQVTDQRRVEYSLHNPKIKGLNPTAGTRLEKTAKNWLGGGGEKFYETDRRLFVSVSRLIFLPRESFFSLWVNWWKTEWLVRIFLTNTFEGTASHFLLQLGSCYNAFFVGTPLVRANKLERFAPGKRFTFVLGRSLPQWSKLFLIQITTFKFLNIIILARLPYHEKKVWLFRLAICG